MSDAGSPLPRPKRRSLLPALAGMAFELVYVAALTGIGLLIAITASLIR